MRTRDLAVPRLLLLAMVSLPGCGPKGLDVQKLEKKGELFGQIDRIAGVVRTSSAETIRVPPGDVEIVGWAIDGSARAPGSGVHVSVNGTSLSCEYGISRSDVAAVLKADSVTYSGYRCLVPEKSLHEGLNTAQILMLTSSTAYLAGPAVVLEVSGGR